MGYNLLVKKDLDKKLIRRLKIIEGQIRGLQRMVSDNKYCIDIITQTSAVKRSLSSIEDAILENHLDTCATKQMIAGNASKARKEILHVYKLKR